MTTHYYGTIGRYYIGKDEQQFRLTLNTPFGSVSELWDKDDAPDVNGLLPTEALHLIEQRLGAYWINTGREETLKKIRAIREHGAEINLEWAESNVKKAEAALKDAIETRDACLSEIDKEKEA